MADSDGDDGLMGNIVDLSASAVDDIEDSGAVPVFSHYKSEDEDFESETNSHAPLINASRPPQHKPHGMRFVFEFPRSWEDFLRKFDDLFIRVCQIPNGVVSKYISLGLTAMVAIEFVMVLPILLFIVGYDFLGAQFLYLAFTMALLSQIPKRFIWRYRPWMVTRAQVRSKPKTSSFSSRAVACAVMYCYMIVDGDLFFGTDYVIHWWGYVILFAVPLVISYSRINLGVHYPSDCIAGFALGVLACVAGKGLFLVDDLICRCPMDDVTQICYADNSTVLPITPTSFHVNYVATGLILAGQLAWFILCLVRPLKIWVKAGTVFGFLFPPMAFRFMFLCPGKNFMFALPPPYIHNTYAIPHWWAILYAIAVCGLGLLGSMKLKSRTWWALAIFLLYWAFFIGAILPWRLFQWGILTRSRRYL